MSALTNTNITLTNKQSALAKPIAPLTKQWQPAQRAKRIGKANRATYKTMAARPAGKVHWQSQSRHLQNI